MYRRLLAFLVSPIAGAAALSLIITISFIHGRLVDYLIEYYSIFIGQWLVWAAISVVVMYFFTLLFVLPAYLFLIHRKIFSLESMLVVGLGVGIVPFLAAGLSAGDEFEMGLIVFAVISGLVGLLSGLVFFMIHGPVRLKGSDNLRAGREGHG